DEGPCATGERQARGGRRAAALREQDPAAVPAALQERLGAAASALPAWPIDGGLPRGAARAARRGRGGPVTELDHAPGEHLAGRVPGVEEAVAGRPRLRIRLGRRRALRRPPRRRAALRTGGDRRAP